MGEIILGLHPQPETPRDFILVTRNGKEITITTDEIWEYEGDAMTGTPEGIAGEQ